MSKPLQAYLSELDSNACSYRSTVNRIFSRKLTTPRHCARYFFDVLKRTSRLYEAYLTLREMEPTIATGPDPDEANRTRRRFDVGEESGFRERLRKRLELLPCWSQFDPNNPFVEENQLGRPADYIANLALHLPEIYGETVMLENCAHQALQQGLVTDSCLADLVVRLDHAAHHVSYCRYALEILSYEDNWRTFESKQ